MPNVGKNGWVRTVVLLRADPPAVFGGAPNHAELLTTGGRIGEPRAAEEALGGVEQFEERTDVLLNRTPGVIAALEQATAFRIDGAVYRLDGHTTEYPSGVRVHGERTR